MTTPGARRPTAPSTPTPTNTPPTGPDMPGPAGAGKKSALSFENWIFWYENNKEDLENLKSAIYSRVTSDNPLGVLAGGEEGGPAGRCHAGHGLEGGQATSVRPALGRWTTRTRATRTSSPASYIALAKIYEVTEDIERLAQGPGGRRRRPATA